MLLLSQTNADSLNVCQKDQKVTVYVESIVSDALVEQQTTLFYEKWLYYSVTAINVFVATKIATIICPPIAAVTAIGGPITVTAVGTSCALGTTAGVLKILPVPERTVQDDFETFAINNYKIMRKVSESVCEVMQEDLTNERIFIYVVKQKSVNNQNDLKGITIEEIVKIDKSIDVKGLFFIPIFLTNTLDYEIGIHTSLNTEVTLMFTEDTNNFFLIKTSHVAF